MGKSKTGGTRSMIRGRVGSDVYSIGRDAKGNKQQVVRSLAETVANPQTINQMRGRMIMATIMQACAGLRPIIDHAFDNVDGRQPNISEFVSRNYALIKADVAANPSSDNSFGLVAYGVKGAARGQYIISDGNANVPAALVLTKATGVITIALDTDAVTIAGLKAKLGMTSEEYFTLVGINVNGGVDYERFRVNPNLADDTAISSSNIASVFATEGNASATVAFASNTITITLASVATCCAVIVSKKTESGYIHSKAVLGEGTGFDGNADTILPTYPVGNADYLNGGDIFGETESFNGGGSPTPTPTPSVAMPTISGTTPFTTSTEVTITQSQGAEIRYTTDGSTPSASSTLYSAAITLTDTTTIKAIAIRNGVSSEVASSTFTKQSSEHAETISYNGNTAAWGGTLQVDSKTAQITLNLPAGSSLIGGSVCCATGSYGDAVNSKSNLVEGDNTITLNSSQWSGDNKSVIGAIYQSGFENYCYPVYFNLEYNG